MARCPGHEDRSPSLSIRELDDGALLLHCFAGCQASDVLAAVGLEFRDLYPNMPDLSDGRRMRRRPRLSGWAVVDAISFRLECVSIIVEDFRRDGKLSGDAMKLLDTTIEEVQAAISGARRVR